MFLFLIIYYFRTMTHKMSKEVCTVGPKCQTNLDAERR